MLANIVITTTLRWVQILNKCPHVKHETEYFTIVCISLKTICLHATDHEICVLINKIDMHVLYISSILVKSSHYVKGRQKPTGQYILKHNETKYMTNNGTLRRARTWK